MPGMDSSVYATGKQGKSDQKGEKQAVTIAQKQKGQAEPSVNKTGAGKELSRQESKEVRELRERDREVRSHEQAHAQAAGTLLQRGPVYEFEQGPDGKRYAINGYVIIDSTAADTPEATVRKAEKVIRAATAPMEPSSGDMQLAAKGRRMKMEALQEVRKQSGTLAEANQEKSTRNLSREQAEQSYQNIAGGTGKLELASYNFVA